MARKVLVAICTSAGLLWSTAFAGSVMVPGIGGDVRVDINSYENRRFDSVIRQQYDFSCGSAAVASLLAFHYEDQVTEHDVFVEMLALADEQKVRKHGFSMLDMKHYLEARGYRADGFRMALSGLREKVRLPMIVGDPARGLKVYSYAQFSDYWNGTAFIIRSHLEQGRDTFLGEGHWPQVARAPVQKGLDDPSLGHILPYWPSTREW